MDKSKEGIFYTLFLILFICSIALSASNHTKLEKQRAKLIQAIQEETAAYKELQIQYEALNKYLNKGMI